ncbi:MAG TPA: hypothetical protein VE860_21595, partial [Chthoniobacterales bacterium]|nr:hypothetical protein [Chthoniobacterales bacterium]
PRRSHDLRHGLPQAAMGLLMELELQYLKDELAHRTGTRPRIPQVKASRTDGKQLILVERLLRSTRSKSARPGPFSGTGRSAFSKYQISRLAPEN